MDDSFLEEQLERMRRLTERMSQAHRRVAENCELISRDRDLMHSGPWPRLHDYRPHQTHDYSIDREQFETAEATTHSPAPISRTPRSVPRRRRRR